MTEVIAPLVGDAVPQHGRHRHRAYLMDCVEYDRLWARAGGRCEVCGIAWRLAADQRLVIDHDHVKGNWAVRGLLCTRCNVILGKPDLAVGPGVDRYLANPWRIEPPASVANRAAEHRYQQIASELRRRIEAGVLPSGSWLPSAVALQREFGVARNTIREAIGVLCAEGLVTSEHGRGTRVGPAQITTIRERIRARMPTTDEAKRLEIPPYVPVLAVTRRTYAGEHVVEVATDIILPADRTELEYEIKLRWPE